MSQNKAKTVEITTRDLVQVIAVVEDQVRFLVGQDTEWSRARAQHLIHVLESLYKPLEN